jgi:hypothetical protein
LKYLLPALLAQLAVAAAMAAEPPAREEPPVRINAIKNPELKPYRVMLAGLEAFDDHHELAPNARELRFRLRPAVTASDSIMENLSLRLAGDAGSMPLPLAADYSFILPRDGSPAGDDADLVLNKKKGDYRWNADIHSDGVPPGMRRLGDLRLECQVVIAVAKKEMPFWVRALVTSFLLSDNWCAADKIQISTVTMHRLAGAVLVEGGRRLPLKLADEGKGFLAPLGDRTFSDEALVELQYAEPR